MGKHLTGKLLERAAAPVQGEMGEIPLTKDHTLTRDTMGTMIWLQFEPVAPVCRLALSSR